MHIFRTSLKVKMLELAKICRRAFMFASARIYLVVGLPSYPVAGVWVREIKGPTYGNLDILSHHQLSLVVNI